MKKFQKLLGGLCLIGSLLAVHPISSADFSVMHKISEKVQRNPKGAALAGALLLGMAAYTWSVSKEGSTLRAAQEYLLKRSELRERQVTSAVSLAFAYAAHHHCKSKPVSAIAGLLSLGLLYLAYKDISLVKDARKSIEHYLDTLCFGGSCWENAYQENLLMPDSPYIQHVSFCANSDISIWNQRESFDSRLKKDENLKSRMKECARELLKTKNFNFEWVESLVNGCSDKNKLMQLADYNEWIVPIIALTIITDGSSCNEFSYNRYDDAKEDVPSRCTKEMRKRFECLFKQEGAKIKNAKRT